MSKRPLEYRTPQTQATSSRLAVFLRDHWMEAILAVLLGNMLVQPVIPDRWGAMAIVSRLTLWLPAAVLFYIGYQFTAWVFEAVTRRRMSPAGFAVVFVLVEFLRLCIYPSAMGDAVYIAWSISLIPIIGATCVILVGLDWACERLAENNYKTLLIARYLRGRRIAWVSLAAVALCTLMVLVVISVMGGWLNMFKKSFRGLSGDIVIHSETLSGFPYYQSVIDAIEKDPGCHVEAAVPSIETAGLYDFGSGPRPVRVMGMNIATIDTVNEFGQHLYLQHDHLEEQLADKTLSQAERDRLTRKLNQLPSFDLLDEVTTPMAQLPSGLKYVPNAAEKGFTPGTIDMPETFPGTLKAHLRFDAERKNLVFRGVMPPTFKSLLDTLSEDPTYRAAVSALYADSNARPLTAYPEVSGKYNGIIVGTGVIGIRRTEAGVWDRPGEIEWTRPTHLTVLDLSGGRVELKNAVTRNFFIVDDSHLGVWQYDSNYVYVDLTLLQRDLGMDEQPDNHEPAKVTDIHIKMKPGIDANDEFQLIAARDRIDAVMQQVLKKQLAAQGDPDYSLVTPKVETWQETQRIWISAIENEKLLTVVLFGIMCIVAIFLIFCIFYMIVVEKTRDIGIIKSVGATSAGVAWIFLGYGLVIGVIGAGMGLCLSYLVIHNINEIHAMLGRLLHIQIWNPQVYLFDKIPNEMNGRDIAWIMPIAVLASVLGALIPAIRAAQLNPVESLRWE